MFKKIHIKPSFQSLIYTKRFALGIGIFVFSAWMSYYLFSGLKNLLYVQDAFGTAYHALILEKETFMQMSFWEEYFLAFLGCLMGQYFFLEFLFFKPRNSFHHPLGRTLIMTNNRNILLNFIAVGGKVFLGLAVFYWGFYLLPKPFLPWVYSVLILLIISLYLQAWISIRQFYRMKIEWLAGLFLFYTILAFTFSKFLIIDVNPAMESIWETRPEARLDLQVSDGDYLRETFIPNQSLSFSLYAGFKNSNSKLYLVKDRFSPITPLDSFNHSMLLKNIK